MSALRMTSRGVALLAAALLMCSAALGSPVPALAAEGDGPDHVLTYTAGSLTWDGQTEVLADGTAHMSLFSETHQNVASSNGERVFAPGTEASNVTRLENQSNGPIRYVAVMYRIKDEPSLPIEPELSGSGFKETDDYPLPDGVQESQVVRAVTGTVGARDAQDFDIAWSWDYYKDEGRDAVDTRLGDAAASLDADEVTAGLYIVVEDASNGADGSYISPSLPKAGDSSTMTVAALVGGVGLTLLAVALLGGREVRRCEGL